MRIEKYLKDRESLRVYKQHMSSVDRLLNKLKEDDRQEVIGEIESHLYEHIAADNSDASELNKLLDAIEKMGSIVDIVEPIAADKMMLYASESMNPTRLLTAFVMNSGRKLRQLALISLFVVFLILVLGIVGVGVAKLFDPSVGLYVGPSVFLFGTVDPDTEASEVLGYWIIPLAAAAGFMGYWILHSLLRFIKTQ